MNRALWLIRGLPASVYLLAGGTKPPMSPEALAAVTPLRAIGLCRL